MIDTEVYQAAEERLNTPGRRSGLRLPRRRFDTESFGRFAEWIARFMGSPVFILWMTVFVIVWITLNVVGSWRHWDPYPFILLNLAFSTQASYAAPLILLAQTRQEQRDRRSLERDRKVAEQSRADTDFLAREIASLRTNVGQLATRDFVRNEIRDQLRDLLAELDKASETAHDGKPDVPSHPTADAQS